MDRKAVYNQCEVYLHQGDITALDVDAIVNAANADLWAGSGVCGAIHRKGGPKIAEECAVFVAAKGRVAVGHAAITTGGNLPARYVIHAVGPIYDDYEPHRAAEVLASAYRNSLALAREHKLQSIAFPCISTGVYGFPPDQACIAAVGAVRGDLLKHGKPAKVVFCTFSASDFALYEHELSQA
jgi:O-acetyl-ADP-ribose deacetylase